MKSANPNSAGTLVSTVVPNATMIGGRIDPCIYTLYVCSLIKQIFDEVVCDIVDFIFVINGQQIYDNCISFLVKVVGDNSCASALSFSFAGNSHPYFSHAFTKALLNRFVHASYASSSSSCLNSSLADIGLVPSFLCASIWSRARFRLSAT